MNEIYEGPLDPNAGVLCFSVYWYPKAGLPDCDGEKVSVKGFIPVAAEDPCLCGSGKTFGACCRRKRYWYFVCPNPGMPGKAGYSILKSQQAIFNSVPGDAVRARLMDDPRLHCSQDSPERSFWIYQGNPAMKTRRGIMCFGDIKLQKNRTLCIIAMSDLRRRILLRLLKEDCGDLLGRPTIQYRPMKILDKQTGEDVILTPESDFAQQYTPDGRRREKLWPSI